MKGNVRWMAPELLNPIAFPNIDDDSTRKAGDIYALSCTALEVIFVPEHELTSDAYHVLFVCRSSQENDPTTTQNTQTILA